MKARKKSFPVEFQYPFSSSCKRYRGRVNGIKLISGIIPDFTCGDVRGTSVVIVDI
jgi:hypothetical protein